MPRPSKYSPELRERAVRMVHEHVPESLASEPRSAACARAHGLHTYMHFDRMAGSGPQFALTLLPGAMVESIGMMYDITLRRECRTVRRTIVRCSDQQMGQA